VRAIWADDGREQAGGADHRRRLEQLAAEVRERQAQLNEDTAALRYLFRLPPPASIQLALSGSAVTLFDVDRREFLRDALGLGALTLLAEDSAVPWERLAHALGERTTMDQRTIDGLELMTIRLEGMEQQVGPHELIGALAGHLDAMTTLLQRPVPSALRPRLASVAAEAAGMLAMARAETGDAARSAADVGIAVALSREANDRALGAWVMGCYTATQPEYRNQPGLRLRHFTEGAFGLRPEDASPRSRAWFAAKAADVYAELGRGDECLRALDMADSLCQRRSVDADERPRHQILGSDDFWLTAERGACLARLGRSDAARAALDAALRVGAADFSHVSLWLLLAKARTFAHDGEPEEACRQAVDVARRAHQVSFDALVREVRRMQTVELEPWAATPAVRDLAEQLRAL
jgi:tetratricopeptide (TPR) repeat protein